MNNKLYVGAVACLPVVAAAAFWPSPTEQLVQNSLSLDWEAERNPAWTVGLDENHSACRTGLKSEAEIGSVSVFTDGEIPEETATFCEWCYLQLCAVDPPCGTCPACCW